METNPYKIGERIAMAMLVVIFVAIASWVSLIIYTWSNNP